MIERIELLIEAAPSVYTGSRACGPFYIHARQLFPLMLDVLKAVELRVKDESSFVQFWNDLEKTTKALDAYCSEHLSEGGKGS